MKTQRYAIAYSFFMSTLGEICTIACNLMFLFIVRHLKDPSQTWKEGVILSLFFGTFMGLAYLIKADYLVRAPFTEIQLQRLIPTLVYGKISRLSLSNLAKVSVGKIMTIINSDLNVITPDLHFINHLIAIPIMWSIMFILIAWLTSWKIAGITFGFCLLALASVLGLGAYSLKIKM